MSIAAELAKLRELHDNGALSDEEFAKAKEALLGRSPSNAPGLAIASLAVSCSALIFGPPGAIAGILLGAFALRGIKRAVVPPGKGWLSQASWLGQYCSSPTRLWPWCSSMS
jgi:hypothetical protein